MNENPHRAIIVDAGNSKVRVAGWRGADQDPRQAPYRHGESLSPATPLSELGVVPTPTRSTVDEFAKQFESLLSPDGNLPLVLTSVVPLVNDVIKRICPEVLVVDAECDLPFGLSLPHPEAIGSDRLCNVAMAAASGYPRALIVDAGTATTFDLLVDGEFIGGLIAPGMAFAADCLAQAAARLSSVPFGEYPLAVGRNTADAMGGGAYHVGLGGVESVIASLRDKYGPLVTVVTGGLGKYLVGPDRLYDPDCTLRGAALLAALPN